MKILFSSYAWNVNLNDGNTNYNNKNYNNYVRAVSEFHMEMENTIRNINITYQSLIEAYYICRKNKSNTYNAINFEINYESNLITLLKEINNKKYEPDKSITFIINKPVYREIFAANFRDRIIHHWICSRIEPLFEEIFIDASFNCRLNKGTLAGIKHLKEIIKEESDSYSNDCYVLKFDLQSFFMSINRAKVTERLCEFINRKYTDSDKEILLYLVRKTLLNAPEKNYIIKGNISDWENVAPHKSLLMHNKEGYGLPIGNLPSQMVANFLLNETDHYITETLNLNYVRYVDDASCVDKNKSKLLKSMPYIRNYLWSCAEVKLHPNKFYLQHYTKGISFIGGVVKKDRLYIGNRTVNNAYKRIHYFNSLLKNLEKERNKKDIIEKMVSSINSYLGLMRHFNAYGLRRKLFNLIDKQWYDYVYADKDYNKLIIKGKYKKREYIKYCLKRQRRKALKF